MSADGSQQNASLLQDIPEHLLCIVFEFLLGWKETQIDRDEELRISTVRNARLTCWYFNELASPYLLPVLTINLNPQSINHATEISSHELIASGIHQLRISLSYYPQLLANSFRFFVMFQMHSLRSVSTWLGRTQQDISSIPEDLEAAMAKLESRPENSRLISTAGDADFTLLNVLEQSHDVFRQRHQEQAAVVKDNFLSQVESISRRARHIDTLNIVQEAYPIALSLGQQFMQREYHQRRLDEDAEMLESVKRFFQRPLSWPDVQCWAHQWYSQCSLRVELPATEIPWEAPIAIYQAGRKLRRLWLNCFLLSCEMHESFKSFVRESVMLARIRSLRTACQYIEEFCIVRPGCWGPMDAYSSYRDGETYISEHVLSIISGKRLQKLIIRMHPKKSPPWNDRYTIGSTLHKRDCSTLTCIFLEHLFFCRTTLRDICMELGGCLREFCLSFIMLMYDEDGDSDGHGWREIFDILREKLSTCGTTATDGRVTLAELKGLEFDEITEYDGIDDIYQRCTDYVCGIGNGKNPLDQAEDAIEDATEGETEDEIRDGTENGTEDA
ncbi:hypothetical protein VFPPC_03416 [Pochonia chlamydosporia 170]|uniref:Uncharacterized protein n=1 Tax=Pochonia chlamydosporia 170 TaxID=1380566 RepID=A0A179G139_METCM|nr:hypothetical protein VFPPC_03416 [Pochonia chlamydosporia 170]OAQ71053.1 hypothetical protein VFPPC_03416 [Pochonia chlamydosporia 170]